jgi:hypothetical protein
MATYATEQLGWPCEWILDSFLGVCFKARGPGHLTSLPVSPVTVCYLSPLLFSLGHQLWHPGHLALSMWSLEPVPIPIIDVFFKTSVFRCQSKYRHQSWKCLWKDWEGRSLHPVYILWWRYFMMKRTGASSFVCLEIKLKELLDTMKLFWHEKHTVWIWDVCMITDF